jgi:rod shape-determining protein MreD
MDSSLRHLDQLFRFSLPVATVLFLVLLNMVPWPWQWLRSMLAPMPLVAICYWVIHRPQLFSMRWSFIIGILQDLLFGQMLGVLAFSYLVADFFLRSHRQFFMRQSFIFIWLAFAVAIAATMALQGLIAFYFMGQPVDMMALAFRAGLGVLLFPLVARLLHGIERRVLAKV